MKYSVIIAYQPQHRNLVYKGDPEDPISVQVFRKRYTLWRSLLYEKQLQGTAAVRGINGIGLKKYRCLHLRHEDVLPVNSLF